MASMTDREPERAAALCLTVPGLCGSGADHWQTYWERQRGDCRRVELGDWDDPSLIPWLAKLDAAIRAADRRPLLVAHSLGCLAVAWWAQSAGAGARVAGAMLVAPPDVDRPDADPRLARFAPAPAGPLPFPTLLIASRDDPYAAFDRLGVMAGVWGARLVDIGSVGHINAQSGLGSWEKGQRLLDGLIGTVTCRPRTPAASPDGASRG